METTGDKAKNKPRTWNAGTILRMMGVLLTPGELDAVVKDLDEDR